MKIGQFRTNWQFLPEISRIYVESWFGDENEKTFNTLWESTKVVLFDCVSAGLLLSHEHFLLFPAL